MISESQIRQRLRDWILTKPDASSRDINDGTLLVDEELITSIDVLDLILLIEDLSGTSIDPTQLQPGSFDSIDKIYEIFFRRHSSG